MEHFTGLYYYHGTLCSTVYYHSHKGEVFAYGRKDNLNLNQRPSGQRVGSMPKGSIPVLPYEFLAA